MGRGREFLEFSEMREGDELCYERCLRILYIDKLPSFNVLLEKDGSVSFHQRKGILKFWQ